MKTNPLLHVILIAMLLAVTSCGGSSSGGGQPPANDNEQPDQSGDETEDDADLDEDYVIDMSEPVWSDEFDEINPDNWRFETGGEGWGNNELQYYTDGDNARIEFDEAIESNVLVIEARKENPAAYECWYDRCRYTSTRLISAGKQEFEYGRFEARIKLPQTQGIWPAFWMLGNDIFDGVPWPSSGEIDIMEHVGFEPTLTHGAVHGPGYSGDTPISGTHDLNESADANYHLYAVEWTPQGIDWYVDDENFYSVTRAQIEQHGEWVFDHPFFILFNVAVGGNWPGEPDSTSTFPQRMYVDYVRVYQK